MESKPPKIKTDGTANPVTLTLGDKLKIIDELEASAVRNFAETGRKYKVSRPTISILKKLVKSGLMCFKIILDLSYSLSYFMMMFMFYSEINIP